MMQLCVVAGLTSLGKTLISLTNAQRTGSIFNADLTYNSNISGGKLDSKCKSSTPMVRTNLESLDPTMKTLTESAVPLLYSLMTNVRCDYAYPLILIISLIY